MRLGLRQGIAIGSRVGQKKETPTAAAAEGPVSARRRHPRRLPRH